MREDVGAGRGGGVADVDQPFLEQPVEQRAEQLGVPAGGRQQGLEPGARRRAEPLGCQRRDYRFRQRAEPQVHLWVRCAVQEPLQPCSFVAGQARGAPRQHEQCAAFGVPRENVEAFRHRGALEAVGVVTDHKRGRPVRGLADQDGRRGMRHEPASARREGGVHLLRDVDVPVGAGLCVSPRHRWFGCQHRLADAEADTVGVLDELVQQRRLAGARRPVHDDDHRVAVHDVGEGLGQLKPLCLVPRRCCGRQRIRCPSGLDLVGTVGGSAFRQLAFPLDLCGAALPGRSVRPGHDSSSESSGRAG